MSRPKALLVVPVLPATGGNGLAMRAGLLLEGLARSCTVHVVVVPVFGRPVGSNSLVEQSAADWRVLEIDHSADGRADLLARLASKKHRARAQVLHPRPAACRPATLDVAAAVAEAAADVDLVVVMRLYLVPFLDVLLERPDRQPLVLDVDDIESRTQPTLGHPGEGRRFEALESHYLPLMDCVLTCSQGDVDYLLARHRLRHVALVPNAIRPPEQPLDGPRRYDLLFVGNLSYRPNAQGVRWLCEQVVPRLDGARVALVGSSPGREIATLAADDKVTLAADVPDVSPWYAASAVAVVPIRSGGGTRIKVLEAFAHRRPVVSTAAGVEGLDLPPVVIADTPEEFARACARLLGDPKLARDLARHGESLVRQCATVERVADAIDSLVRDIVAA
jgi:glycosyltransferase involved in cell wall biosynthesis